jgi:hypothetical protein
VIDAKRRGFVAAVSAFCIGILSIRIAVAKQPD